MKNRVAAALIAFFAGGFGIHHFYLGNKGKGIAYLLFFWTLIPSILAFIDFFVLIFMEDREFDKKYNANQYEYEDEYDYSDELLFHGDRQTDSTQTRYQGLDLDKLEKLGKLRENGVLTEEEFQAQKEFLFNHR